MTKHLRLITVTAGLLLAGLLSAQSVNIPYMMSFEVADSLEWQNWHINTGVNAPACRDQWMIGTDQKSDGHQALYISNNGISAHYGVGPNVQFAYRDFLLPQGFYTVSFDWKNTGDNNSVLYAGCGPANNLVCNALNTTGALPAAYLTWCQQWVAAGTSPEHYGQRYWQNARLQGVNSNGTRVMRLFFAWCSSNTDTTIINPIGACIDNAILPR